MSTFFFMDLYIMGAEAGRTQLNCKVMRASYNDNRSQSQYSL